MGISTVNQNYNSAKIVNEQTQKTDAGKFILGAGAGWGIGIVGQSMPNKILGPVIDGKVQKVLKSIPDEALPQINTALRDTLEMSGLKAKGVEVLHVTDKNFGDVVRICKNDFGKFLQKLWGKKADKLAENVATAIKDGCNACYSPSTNKLIMPAADSKFSSAGFHEMGHAMNANFSKIGKILAKSRRLQLLITPIMLISLLKNKKAEGEKPTGFFDKASDFTKNNAGKLTFLAFLPLLVEEGMASIKGQKFAKKLLDPQIFKKMAKINSLGFLSYLGLAALSGLGVALGVKVRDAIVHNKQVDKA